MRIGIAQINAVARDFPGNARRLLQAYRECLEGDAEWVVAPELLLAGYRRSVRDAEKCLQALDYLSGEIKETPLVLGHLDSSGASVASVLIDGEVKASFQGGGVFEWRGRRIGISLGGSEIEGGEIHLSLACRRFVDGGFERSRQELAAKAIRSGIPLVHCNAVGADGEFVYPGQSAAFSSQGDLIAALWGFEEQCLVVDLSTAPSIVEDRNDLADLEKALVSGIADRARKSGYLGVVFHHDGSFAAEVLSLLAEAAVGKEQVESVAFSSSSDPDSRIVNVDPVASAVEAALGDFGIADERPAITSLLLSSIAERRGYLTLFSVSRTGILTGDFSSSAGFAPFGDLSATRLRELGRFLQIGEASSIAPASDEIVHLYAETGLSIEALVARGYREPEILKCQRRVDLAGLSGKPAPGVLRLGS
jgi:NAD+ synthase (glutamine-hydrolysing)